jgi:excisionase family DNA binding protein
VPKGHVSEAGRGPKVPTSAAPLAYSPQAAADLLGISRATIYNLLERGELVAIKLGKCRRIPAAELTRLLAGGNA